MHIWILHIQTQQGLKVKHQTRKRRNHRMFTLIANREAFMYIYNLLAERINHVPTSALTSFQTLMAADRVRVCEPMKYENCTFIKAPEVFLLYTFITYFYIVMYISVNRSSKNDTQHI